MKTKTRSNVLLWVMKLGLPLITVLACFFMLEFSVEPKMTHVETMEWKYILLNLLTIGVLLAFFLIVSNRVWLSCLLCGTFWGIIAVVNYYVIRFHSMPLSVLELKNLSTALNVVSGYTLEITDVTKKLLLLLLALVLLCLLCRHFTKEHRLRFRSALIRDAALGLACVLVIATGYLGQNPVKPKNTMGWLWREPYYQYGYAACTVESIQQSFNVVKEPEGYSQNALDSISIPAAEAGEGETPDIILILNETFYDLRQITDIETDAPYMENMEGMENLLTGYAVAPSNGGGTNSSEYEVLTSNSLKLMPGVTPFNVLDLEGANSIVSHLSALGYASVGAHSEAKENYSRLLGYAGLGFQDTYFSGDFTDLDFYGDRIFFETDESLYNNLFRWYEETMPEGPRFMYLLTIQNHGGWDTNAPELDTVHSLTDYGDYTQQVNEFLSCIQMTDQAFTYLTDYFSQVDRPVIVCMLGDHCPSFAEAIADEGYTAEEKALRLRSVPLVIWANFPLEDRDLGTMSMNYVAPTLLDIAGVELSPFYRYMLALKEDVPILTSYSGYYDAEGKLYDYDSQDSPYKEGVDGYLYLEYNNLQANRKQELFDPIK